MDVRTLTGQSYRRTAPVERAAVDMEARTVSVAFSSELPVPRWGGQEVLVHTRKAVRLGRLDGGAVLVGHDHSDQVGVVERAWIDGQGKVGRASLRFGRSARAEEILRDVADGIRRQVSVGYVIHRAEETSAQTGETTIRVVDWEPYEISLVSVAADPTVGVGRSIEERTMVDDEVRATEPEQVEPEASPPKAEVREAVKPRDVTNTRDPEIARQIRELGEHFGMQRLAEDHVAVGSTVKEFQAILKRYLDERLRPVPIATQMPSIQAGRQYRAKKLRAFQPNAQGEREAFESGMWARATLFGDTKADLWCKEHGIRTMTTSVFTAGGAVVPDQMSQAIIDLREQYGVARQICRVVPMASDTLIVPRRTGGVTAYFVGETSEITASDKSWDQVTLVARKLAALTKLSTDYAEDAVIDVADDLAAEMAYAFALKEDQCLIDGDGSNTYGGIQGIRPKIIDGNHAAGAIDAASGVDQLPEVTADDLSSLIAKLPVYAQPGARWLCSQAANALIFDSLKQAAGGNTMMMLGDRPALSYLGYPITISQVMPAGVATDYSNVAILFLGDFRQAVTLGDRRGFTVRVLQERYAEYDQLGVVATERFDIVVHDIGDGTNPGPVVGLIGE